jgi:E3 ubiquitin-protein ligase HERC3
MQILEQVLGYCGPMELGALEATSSYFIKSGITERVAHHFLREIPRAKGLRPDVRRGESYVTLLNFVNGQSNAAAQGTAVALGTYHTVALLTRPNQPDHPEYSLFTAGRGFHGQLGMGDYSNRQAPARVDTVERDRPVQLYRGVPDDIQLAVVSAGSSHTASISRRGELYTWGLASSGELGHGGWTPIELPVPKMITSLYRTRIVSVCAGANHTLAISEIGQLWSCGRGRHGQLGHGHFHDEGVLTLVEAIRGERIVSAAAGKAHSLALAADGKIFTWGDAKHGQLGHQQLVALMQGPNPQPIAIPFPQAIQSLDPIKLKPPARVTAIAAGGDHSMAVTVGGTLLAFGSNNHGQLGLGDTLDRMIPTEVPLALENDPTETGGALVRCMQVQCGAMHTLVLVQKGGRVQVRASGDNSYGQLGVGDRKDRNRFTSIKVFSGGSNSGSTILGGGSSKSTTTTTPTPTIIPRIVCITAGDWHNAAVAADGRLYLWGRGDCGQLGHDDDKSRWQPKLLEGGYGVVHPDRTLRRNRKAVLKTLLLPASDDEVGKRSIRTRSVTANTTFP